LTSACLNGQLEVVKFLLRNNADVECLNNVSSELMTSHSLTLSYQRGDTPLSLSCLHGYLEVVQTLVAAGVDINRVTVILPQFPSLQCS
jgi:ankyrin repeat protein